MFKNGYHSTPLICCGFVFFVFCCMQRPVLSSGILEWGEDCSIADAVLSVIICGSYDPTRLCNRDKGLLCGGTCVCASPRIWDRDFLSETGDLGNCVVVVNDPCTGEDYCVDNAECREVPPICTCNAGFIANGSWCVQETTRDQGLDKLNSVIQSDNENITKDEQYTLAL